MKILKDEEPDYFLLCRDDARMKVLFDTIVIEKYQENVLKTMMLKHTYLQRISYDVRIEEEKIKHEKLEKRLQHLRKLKRVKKMISANINK